LEVSSLFLIVNIPAERLIVGRRVPSATYGIVFRIRKTGNRFGATKIFRDRSSGGSDGTSLNMKAQSYSQQICWAFLLGTFSGSAPWKQKDQPLGWPFT
jgi:hypothetical protein